MRKCATCPEMFQPTEAAEKRKVGSDYSYCKGCRSKNGKRRWRANDSMAVKNSESRIRTTYGLEPEQYNAMLAKQGGGCAVCGRKNGRRNKPGGRMAVDHCHSTGRIRGLLCQPCNTALGLLDDDEERIRRLASYLEASNEPRD